MRVLSWEMSGAEAARRHGVSDMSVSKWKQQFLEAGCQRL
ncbi:helix-turn-helix domain-containing protein [Prescottella equi]